MRSRVLLAFCAILAVFALVVGSRAADDKDNKKASQQKKETVAKPMTDRQKRAAEKPEYEKFKDELTNFLGGAGFQKKVEAFVKNLRDKATIERNLPPSTCSDLLRKGHR